MYWIGGRVAGLQTFPIVLPRHRGRCNVSAIATKAQPMTGATRRNQERIIANERKILRNQDRLVGILANQDKILRDLQAMLRNQKKILANQSKILAK